MVATGMRSRQPDGERMVKTGARLVRHTRYAVFQLTEAALPGEVFAGVLGLINRVRGLTAKMASA